MEKEQNILEKVENCSNSEGAYRLCNEQLPSSCYYNRGSLKHNDLRLVECIDPDLVLPPLLEVRGDLILSGRNLFQFPYTLKVGGNLDLSKTNQTEIRTTHPYDFQVGGDLILDDTPLVKLPDDFKVWGDLVLRNTKITKLPKNLYVGRNLNLCGLEAITCLPENLYVGEVLDLKGTNITKLPTSLELGKGCKIYMPTQNDRYSSPMIINNGSIDIVTYEKTIEEWDDWFKSDKEFECPPRKSDRFKEIEESYYMLRDYLKRKEFKNVPPHKKEDDLRYFNLVFEREKYMGFDTKPYEENLEFMLSKTKEWNYDLKKWEESKHNPDLANAYNNLGLAHYNKSEAVLGGFFSCTEEWSKKNNLDKAIFYFKKALNIYLKNYKWPKCREALSTARTHYNLSLAYSSEGRYGSAIKHVEQALYIIIPRLGDNHPCSIELKRIKEKYHINKKDALT